MSMSDVATEVAVARGAQLPDPSGVCCWGVLILPITSGILVGLYLLVERIHQGAGSSDAEAAATLMLASLVALWICWHVTSANAYLGLPVLVTAYVLMFVIGEPNNGGIPWLLSLALFLLYAAVASLVRIDRPLGFPFMSPLLIVGPLVVFSSWFWWDVFGIAGWGAVIAAVPIGGILLFVGAAVNEDGAGN